MLVCQSGLAEGFGGTKMQMASDDELEIRFQEAHGAHLFREGKPRALLEVKSPNISPAIYEARLRGYDRAAKAAKDHPSLVRK